MTQSDDSTLSALDELDAIRTCVLKAQTQLKSGEMPNMTYLESRTADLCRLVREASKDIQAVCIPELKGLAQQLSQCEKDLRDFYGTIILHPDQQQ